MPRPIRLQSLDAPTRSGRRPVTILRPAREERLEAVRRRLGVLLAVYATGLQLASAVEGASWHWPLRATASWEMSAAALVGALLRGFPLGYFLAFGLRRRRVLTASGAASLALAAAMAMCDVASERPVAVLELVLVPAGAVVGAIGFLALARRLRAAAASEAVLLAPDLPLIGGAYVAAPLLWLAASSAAGADGGGAPWGLVALALYGASLIGSARASRGSAAGGAAAHAAAAGVWCLAGFAPLAPVAPQLVAVLALTAAVFAALHPLLLGVRGRDRRVEGPALRRALPLLALYLGLAALSPLAATFAGRAGRSPIWAVLAASVPSVGWAELVASMAVLGYAVSELRGRRDELGSVRWRYVAPWVAALAAPIAALRAYAGPHAQMLALVSHALVAWAVCVVAARAGAGLYEQQRRHARAHALEGPISRVAPVRERDVRSSRSPNVSRAAS